MAGNLAQTGVAPAPGVYVELAALEELLGELREMTEKLQIRLAPVLRVALPGQATEETNQFSSGVVPLVHDIHELRCGFADQVLVVEDILYRLEL